MRPTRRLLTALAAAGALTLSLLPGSPAVGRPVVTAPLATAPVTTAASGSASTTGSAGGGDPYFPLYGNGGYNVMHYGLDIRYNPTTDVLTGKASLKIRAKKRLSRFNLDLVGLKVTSVTVNGHRARWKRTSDHELVVTPKHRLADEKVFSVIVRYHGKPRTFSDPNLGTYGFLKTKDGAIAVGEPEVAAYWFPVNDHPQDKATYRVSLTVPKKLRAISNGLPSKTKVHQGWATTTWRNKHRIASYLVFMAVGDFTMHSWKSTSGLPIIDAVDPAISKAVRKDINASLAKQGKILAEESKWFGPYPFEAAGAVVDQVVVGFALENQTRPTYSTDFWEGGQDDGVVVHELAHQWYGDSVSLHRWKDIWLNEGFATYAEWLWTEHTEGVTPAQIFDELNSAIPADDEFWTIPPGAPGHSDLFDAAVYYRGGMTLQALRSVVGDRDFFAILRAWPRLHRDGHGTTKQFIALSEKISRRQLDRLFNEWLYQKDKPTGWQGTGAAQRQLSTSAQRARARTYVAAWRKDVEHRLSVSPRY